MKISSTTVKLSCWIYKYSYILFDSTYRHKTHSYIYPKKKCVQDINLYSLNKFKKLKKKKTNHQQNISWFKV